MKLNYPSLSQFQQFVELKDYRRPTKKEYVRNVCKLAQHFQCDPATLTENQLREYFLFLRQHKHYKSAPMQAACAAARFVVGAERNGDELDRGGGFVWPEGFRDCAGKLIQVFRGASKSGRTCLRESGLLVCEAALAGCIGTVAIFVMPVPRANRVSE